MKTIILILAAASLSLASPSQDLAEFASGNFERFSTKNHPKANGVALTMKYPKNWYAKEGGEQVTVQCFCSSDDLVMATLNFVPLPGEPLLPNEVESLLTTQEIKELLPENGKFISSKASKIDGLPVGILEFSMRNEGAGDATNLRCVMFIFLHHNVILQANFAVMSSDAHADGLSQRMAEYLPVFSAMANSIVIEK